MQIQPEQTAGLAAAAARMQPHPTRAERAGLEMPAVISPWKDTLAGLRRLRLGLLPLAVVVLVR